MCVIIIARNAFPSMLVLEQAEESNPDGAGMAWSEEGKIKFVKGLKARDIFELGQVTPGPWVIHFRWASFGPKDPKLCHPFPINKTASLELRGEERSVLFHNGHIKNIEQRMYEALARADMMCPSGPWSDSRGMAFVIDKFGMPMLNFQPGNQKFAVMSMIKKGDELVPQIFKYGEWEKLDGLELSAPLLREKKFTCEVDFKSKEFQDRLLNNLWSPTETTTNMDISSVPYWRKDNKWSKTL